MKTLLLSLLLLCTAASGGDLIGEVKLKNGTVLKDVEVKELTDKGLRLVHSEGVGVYRTDHLPEEVRRKYAPTKEEQALDEVARKAQRMTAAEKDAAAAKAKGVVPGLTRAECAALWGAAAGVVQDETDWALDGLVVTAKWKEDRLCQLTVSGGDKSWAAIARSLRMENLTASDAADLTPVRTAWTLSDTGGIKWNVKATRTKPGAAAYSVVQLAP